MKTEQRRSATRHAASSDDCDVCAQEAATARSHSGAQAGSDYLGRGQSGRRNLGILAVLALHWALIAGLIVGIGPIKDALQPPDIKVSNVDEEYEEPEDPLPTPPELPVNPPVEVWIPVPPIPVDPPTEEDGVTGSPEAAPPGPDVPVRLDARYPPTRPDYPAGSIRQEEEGSVGLLLLVGPDGRVIEARVDRSSGHPRLDAAALDEAKTWRFRPAEDNGRAVAAWYRTSVRFELDDVR